MIARRHVIHVAGYDPVAPVRHHRRFARELAAYARLWNVTAAASDLSMTATGATWSVTTQAPNWRVATTYETFDWDDIVRADLAVPMSRRLVAAVETYADFIVSGTARRYFSASHRYALFFLVPLFDLLLFAVLAVALGSFVAGKLPLGGVGEALAWLAVTVAAFCVLLRWPGRAMRLDQALADWNFARDYMHGKRADVEARLDAFAARLVAVMQAGEADEVLVVGHSLGALLAIDLLDRALKLDPGLARHRARLSLLTVGATIPKLTLHPDGKRLRACARHVAATASLDWVEYQSRDDAISFYKFHPVSSRRLADDDGTTRPLVRRVQMHEMLTKESFARYRFRFMRIHYQFVMANERRAAYDFFMLVCGPISLLPTAQAAGGTPDLFGDDGAVLAERDVAR
jgi:pimeloyl-ACP methyl ester carboxylesterase